MKQIATAVLLSILSFSGFADLNSGTREVLLDNETVEVVRLTYPPASESGMHTHHHPNRVVYVIQGGKLELIPADTQQQVQVLEIKVGEALFLPATTHNVRNIGETSIVIIETEIK